MDDRVHLRVSSNGLKDRIDRCEEVFSETWTLAFIPQISFGKILLSLRSDD
jgi:hypothetical protein